MIRLLTLLLLLSGTIFCVYGQDNIAVKTEEVVYKIVDNDTLKIRLYYPNNHNNDSQYPCIVFFYGGGWKGGTVEQFDGQSKYFASRGIISVVADYRVKSRHGTSPFEAVKDAKSAMRYVRGNALKFGIDPDRIVGSGGSAGGHLAAATSMISGLNEETDDLSVSPVANALVLYNPVIDNGPNGYGYERIGDRYLEISPFHNVNKNVPPMIFLLGDTDKWIPVSTAHEFQDKVEAVGGRCEVIIYEDQLHGFFNKGRHPEDKYYIETTRAVDTFLQSLGYLNGESRI